MPRARRLAAVAAAVLFAAATPPSFGQTLRIAMTASDTPTTTGIPNNGGEGFRFCGFPAFDGLIDWDFTHPERIAGLTPGLASEWKIDDGDHTRWVFHDGTDMTVDAVGWKLQRFFDDKSPQFDAAASAIVRSFVNMVDHWQKTDETHLAIYTKAPFSFFPYMVPTMLIVSPAQWEKAGRNWAEFGKAPAGTGPFKITKVVPGQSVEMSRNEGYWDKARIPKLAKMILIPMPEATTRLTTGNSPFRDKRVRQAANFAIDRDGLVNLLNGTAEPASGLYPENHPIFGKPANHYVFDLGKSKALLKEAGYSGPVKAKIMISTSGSGQMLPLPMNEYLQQSMKEAGFDIDFEVVEWGSMLVAVRSPPDAPAGKGVDAINCRLSYIDPSSLHRYHHTASFSPANWNWGHFTNPKIDELLAKAQETFVPAERDTVLASAHELIVDEAPWVWFVHDLNPRAMSAKVKGFRPAQSWFQDFTGVYMD
jgi:peptide/nickel transport system substrate-binding protein